MAKRKFVLPKRRSIILGIVLVFFIGWPTILAIKIRWQVAGALSHAKSVRLEEFLGHDVLTSVELPRPEWTQVVAAMPIVPDIGVPGIVKMCFIPHHRIVIVGERGKRFEVVACFMCDQAATTKTGIFATPYLWCNRLRHLFTDYHIRIRDAREYTDLEMKHFFPVRTPTPVKNSSESQR